MNDQCNNCEIRKMCYLEEPKEDWTCNHYESCDDLTKETEEVKDMNKIVICPYRTYTEVRPAILKGQGNVTVTGFMDCLREQCPAFRVKGEYSYRLGETEYTEHCLRLEGEKK